MATGIIALFDDIAAIAKAAATSLDDIAAQAAQAGTKAAGIVIDDTAVTPRYVVGLAPSRELPIIYRIALGSLKNKLVILLPLMIAMSMWAPWALTPLLMVGGVYLAYEGAEKLFAVFFPHAAHEHEVHVHTPPTDAKEFEMDKVAAAVRTDFILSAEIMAITLAAVADKPLVNQIAVLFAVGVAITVAVYGVVGVIVKLDDIGLALSRRRPRAAKLLGRALVNTMPPLLAILAAVGTVAMLWVGGGIMTHGLASHGFHGMEHLVSEAATRASHAVGFAEDFTHWLVEAVCHGLFGIVVGLIAIPAAEYVLVPSFGAVQRLFKRR
jgi:predicted DNA repair protein MutK